MDKYYNTTYLAQEMAFHILMIQKTSICQAEVQAQLSHVFKLSLPKEVIAIGTIGQPSDTIYRFT